MEEQASKPRILSLDSGGLRVLSSLFILQELMMRIANEEKRSEPVHPWQVFDLIGGAGFGGLIAIMLGRLRMSVEECIDEYQEWSELVVTSERSLWIRFPKSVNETKAFEQFLKHLIVKRGLSENEAFEQSDPACKVCVLATSLETRSVALLRSYASPSSKFAPNDLKVWQASRATTAAPTFFEGISLGSSSEIFVDGGLSHSNPVESVLEEARGLWRDRVNGAILVSIGTGMIPPPLLHRNKKETLEFLQSTADESEAVAQRFYHQNADMVSSGRYFRLSLEGRSYDLEKDMSPARLRVEVFYYLERVDVETGLRKCVQALASTSSTADDLISEKKTSIGKYNQQMLRTLGQYTRGHPYGAVSSSSSVSEPRMWDALRSHSIYSTWISSKSSILWLHGLAGTGKSKLCRQMSQHPEAFESLSTTNNKATRPSILISFFCSENFGGSDQTFAGLLYQIIEQCPEISSKLVLDIQNSDSTTLSLKFCIAIEAALQGNLISGLTCIIDGLDEQDSKSIHLILASIEKLANAFNDSKPAFPFLRFFIASRPIHLLKSQMSSEIQLQLGISELIGSQGLIDYIADYIDAVFEREEYDFLLEAKPWIKKVIIEKSNGIFLWTHLVLQELEYTSAQEAIYKLETIPNGLYGLYDNVLAKIPDSHRKRVLDLLGWIVVARRELTLKELSPCLLLSSQGGHHINREEVVRRELQFCLPLCVIREDRVMQAHSSVGKYLLSEAQISDTDAIEAQIVNNCFECLSAQDWIPPNVTNPSFLTDEELDLEAFPLLKYALYYWPEHARSVKHQSCEFLRTDASFYRHISPRRAAWYELYARHCKAQGNESLFFPSALPESFSAIHLAAFLGLDNLAERLITNVEDVNVQDNLHRIPLAYALYFGHATVAKRLFTFPEAQVDYLDSEKHSPAHYAAAGGHMEVLQLILSLNVSPNTRDLRGNTPLHVAVTMGKLAPMQVLIEYGADVHLTNIWGWTSLHLACKAGYTTITSKLLEWGADPNAKDYRNETPFHFAARNGNEQIIQCLLDYKANPSIKNNNGETALTVAHRFGNQEVGQVIRQMSSLELGESESVSNSEPAMFKTDPCGYIENLLKDLPNFKEPKMTLDLEVRWEVLKFIDKELSGDHNTIPFLVTLSGESSKAVAKQCKDYIASTWPKTGSKTFQLLAALFGLTQGSPEQTSQLSSSGIFDLNVRIYPEISKLAQPEKALVTVTGTREHVIEVVQLIAWFACVFRIPIPDRLGFSTLEKIELSVLDDATVLMIDLSKVTAENPKGKPDQAGTCWQPLFRNSVMAYGFPVPERGNETGLEIPFDIMIALAGIEKGIPVAPSSILIGPTAIILPVASRSKSVQWHLVSRNEDEDLSSFDVVPLPKQYQIMRTFLGFCETAEVVVGTSSFNHTDVAPSTADREQGAPHIKDNAVTATASASGGPIHSSFGASASATFTFPKGLQANKDKNFGGSGRLLSSRDRSVIVYDVSRETGWLVPEVSVALWIAHAFIRWNIDGIEEKEAVNIRAQLPVLHAKEQGDGAEAAFSVINRHEKAPLWTQTNETGLKQVLFIDVINYVLACFDNRRDRVNADTGRIRIRESIKLYGWEASDIVDGTGTDDGSDRKEVSLNFWPSIVRSPPTWWQLCKDPKLLVLFSADLPDLVRPAEDSMVCTLWQKVPKNANLLVASIKCLIRMAKKHGYTNGGFFKITKDMGWNAPIKQFYKCFTDSCNPVQQLLPVYKLQRNFQIDDIDSKAGSGAIIFGRSGSSKLPKALTCEPIRVSKYPKHSWALVNILAVQQTRQLGQHQAQVQDLVQSRDQNADQTSSQGRSSTVQPPNSLNSASVVITRSESLTTLRPKRVRTMPLMLHQTSNSSQLEVQNPTPLSSDSSSTLTNPDSTQLRNISIFSATYWLHSDKDVSQSRLMKLFDYFFRIYVLYKFIFIFWWGIRRARRIAR